MGCYCLSQAVSQLQFVLARGLLIMKLRLILVGALVLLWQCRGLIYLMTKVRSRMVANHLVSAQGEIESTIRNVRMWIRNEKE